VLPGVDGIPHNGDEGESGKDDTGVVHGLRSDWDSSGLRVRYVSLVRGVDGTYACKRE
jgi:hypothetical protein